MGLDLFNTSTESLESLLQKVQSIKTPVALDTETTGLRWQKNRAFGVSLAFGNQSYFLRNDTYGKNRIAEFLRSLIANANDLIFHNAKFDAHILKLTYDIDVPFDKVHDTYTVTYLYDNESSHELKQLAKQYISPDADKYEIAINEYNNAYRNKNYALIPAHILDVYAQKDAEYTLKLFHIIYPKLSANNKAWYEIERRILGIVYKMEEHGILIDIPYLHMVNKELDKALSILEKAIHSVAGYPINILSEDELANLLYKKLKQPILSYTSPSKTYPEGKASTDKYALAQLEHPVAKKILQYKEIYKLRYTYTENYLDVDSNNRLHPTWNPLGAITGRFTSADPNFQNQKNEPLLKRAVIGKSSLLEFDYNQVEFRLAGHIANESTVIDSYKNDPNIDYHVITGSQMYNVPLETITKDSIYRRGGKTLNFAILFGEGPDKLASQLKCQVSEAKEKIDIYFQRAPGLKKAIYNFKKRKRDYGYVTTIFGRDIQVKRTNDYAVFNTIVQGSASDLLKLSLVNIDKEFGPELVNTIHDSGYVENMPLEDIPALIRTLEDFHLSIPIKVAVKYSSHDLASMKEWTTHASEEQLIGKER